MRKTTSIPNAEIRRILVVEPWNIGDLVLLMPFLAQLRVLFPRASVTLLARTYASEIFRESGLVDEFIGTDITWSERETKLNPMSYRWAELLRLRRLLRAGNFDIAFKTRAHIREHFVLAISGAKKKVAFSLGQGDDMLTDPLHRDLRITHKADDWLGLLAPFGGAVTIPPRQLAVTPAEAKWAEAFLAAHSLSPRERLIGVHPGASIEKKRWPLDKFRDVANVLADSPGTKVLVFSDPEGYGKTLGEVGGVISARVELRQMMALLERCELLVCNDSGPMHLAAALGTRTVSIFGTGIPQWFAPLGDEHVTVTPETNDPAPSDSVRGIEDITAERVLSAVNAAIEAS